MESKITNDGATYDVTEQVEQAVGKVMSRVDTLTSELADLKKQYETERARADAAEESLEAEKKARADAADPAAVDPAKLRAAVDTRPKLQTDARPTSGDDAKLDEHGRPRHQGRCGRGRCC